jgi:hypothetical protein
LRLCPSSRANQKATPSASSAAPATRATVAAPSESRDTPSSSETGIDGAASRARPVAPSTEAFLALAEAAKHYPCIKRAWVEFLGEPPGAGADRVDPIQQ